MTLNVTMGTVAPWTSVTKQRGVIPLQSLVRMTSIAQWTPGRTELCHELLACDDGDDYTEDPVTRLLNLCL